MRYPILTILMLFTGLGSVPRADAAAREAVCLVCQVREGATHAEPVRATRMHEGREYAFCAEGCARAFEADPMAFLAPPSGPDVLPEFTLTTLDGQPVPRDSLTGRLMLLDFWATWCAPCRKSMPDLQALHARHGERGLDVIGVSIDARGPGVVKRFLAKRSFTYRMLMDTGERPLWEALGVRTIPAAFLVDAEGRILERWLGRAPTLEQLEGALEGRLPVAARP